jgi:hypothetical protein
VDGQIDPSFVVVPTELRHKLCGQSMGADIMLVCDWCSRGWHMGCLTLLLDKAPKHQSTNDFVLGALNKLKFFKSHSKINLNFSFMVMHIWLRI